MQIKGPTFAILTAFIHWEQIKVFFRFLRQPPPLWKIGFILKIVTGSCKCTLNLTACGSQPVLDVCTEPLSSAGFPPLSRCGAGMRSVALLFVRLRCLRCDLTAKKTTKQTAFADKETSYTPVVNERGDCGQMRVGRKWIWRIWRHFCCSALCAAGCSFSLLDRKVRHSCMHSG